MAAEATARKVIAQNARNPRGYFVLAEALEEQQKFQDVVDALAPAVAQFRGTADGAFALGSLLPHLGFAYQELGQYDKAIQTFEDARKLAPNDGSMIAYLVRAQMAAKNFAGGDRHGAGRTRPEPRRSAARQPRGHGAPPRWQGRPGRGRDGGVPPSQAG